MESKGLILPGMSLTPTLPTLTQASEVMEAAGKEHATQGEGSAVHPPIFIPHALSKGSFRLPKPHQNVQHPQWTDG